MNPTLTELPVENPPVILQLRPALNMTEDQFFEFCQINRDLRLERNSDQELIIMPPAGNASSGRNAEITIQLGNWAKKNGTGKSFDSSTGYRLANGAMRSPDASWVSLAKLNTFTAAQREKFLPISPEFVVELRSPTDRISDLEAKMQEYMESGSRMGLLIIPELRRVYVFQNNQPVRELDNQDMISCDPVLPGFELDMREIW